MVAGERKRRNAHTIPLPPLAIRILETIPRIAPIQPKARKDRVTPLAPVGTFVFSVNAGQHYVTSLKHAKAKLVKRVPGLEAWHTHDLRRSCSSGMGELRISAEMVGRVLGQSLPKHLVPDATPIYEQAERKQEMLDVAFSPWNDHVEQLAANAPALPPLPVKVRKFPNRKADTRKTYLTMLARHETEPLTKAAYMARKLANQRARAARRRAATALEDAENVAAAAD
jgi:hypothetical protein